jgi:hypothetical protein
MAETFFNFFTILPLPIWASMILFPRSRFTQRLVLSNWPYIVLGGIYTVLLIGHIFMTMQPLSFSFQALQAALDSELGLLAGWMHYLTLDLFVGVWIFRDAKYWGISVSVFLLITLFAGPLGLAGYLIIRQRKSSKDPIKNLN